MATSHAPMATYPSAPHPSPARRSWLATPRRAYAMAWSLWFAYLLLPLFLFLGVTVYVLANGRPAAMDAGKTWFFAMIAWLAIVVPLAFLARSRLYFSDYWQGRPVSPHHYFWGMALVWTAIELAGVISLIGCAVSRDLAPCLIPALVAFLLFVTQWPNATAMADMGQTDDPARFRFPR